MQLKHHIIIAGLLIVTYLANPARGADGCCHHCGCPDECERVCRLVREDKKVNVICWGCKCEEFCAPGKSHRVCKNGEEVCQDCDPSVCSQSKNFVWYDWEPGFAKHIFTMKKLMKKTVTKTVPNFKWVVEDLCQACQATCPCALIPAGATVPAPPLPDARLIGGIPLPLENSNADATIVPANTSRSVPSQLLRSFFSSDN